MFRKTVAHLLRHWGHRVTLTREVLDIEATDETVFKHACQQQLVMLNCNRNDFWRWPNVS